MSRLTEEELVLMENATGAHRWLKLIHEVRLWRFLEKEFSSFDSLDELIASLTSCTHAWHDVFDLCVELGMSVSKKKSGMQCVVDFIRGREGG